MNSSAVPSAARRSASRSRTCAWTDTSRAETGSSQTSTSGRGAMARAMATRWRCPPESCRGWRSARSRRPGPTRSSSSTTRSRRSARAERSATSLADRPPGVEGAERVLGDRPACRAAAGAPPPLGDAAPRRPSKRDGARGRARAARAAMPGHGRLARTGLADDAERSRRGRCVKIDVRARRCCAPYTLRSPVACGHDAAPAAGAAGAAPPGRRRAGARGTPRTGRRPAAVRVYGCPARDSSRGRRPLLDDPAVPHDQHPVGDPADHGQVVADQQQRDARPRVRSASRRRICACTVTSRAVVGSSAISSGGLAGDRRGDQRALAQPAGELVRILPGAPLRLRHVHRRRAAAVTRPARARRPTRWVRSTSPISAPTVRSGSSETSASCEHQPGEPAAQPAPVPARYARARPRPSSSQRGARGPRRRGRPARPGSGR